MAGLTHLDEMVDYKYEILSKIMNDQIVMDLMTDTHDVDLNSEEADDVRDDRFHDYLFIDETMDEARADVMVESAVVDFESSTMKTIEIYIQVVVTRSYQKIGFSGIKGNRLDNLCRYIDLVLRGSRDFGIGELQLQDCMLNTVPDDFISKMLVYEIQDYAEDRSLK